MVCCTGWTVSIEWSVETDRAFTIATIVGAASRALSELVGAVAPVLTVVDNRDLQQQVKVGRAVDVTSAPSAYLHEIRQPTDDSVDFALLDPSGLTWCLVQTHVYEYPLNRLRTHIFVSASQQRHPRSVTLAIAASIACSRLFEPPIDNSILLGSDCTDVDSAVEGLRTVAGSFDDAAFQLIRHTTCQWSKRQLDMMRSWGKAI